MVGGGFGINVFCSTVGVVMLEMCALQCGTSLLHRGHKLYIILPIFVYPSGDRESVLIEVHAVVLRPLAKSLHVVGRPRGIVKPVAVYGRSRK